MIPTKLIDIASWSGGALIAGVPSETISHISTDTRSIKKGDAFLALRGENFNGHEFVEKAIESGASILILSELPPQTVDFSGNIVHVRDTLKALQEIALNYRRQAITDCFPIGVTGSNGKTSTKDFLRSVLNEIGPVNATKGNLNNHIGLPQTVLSTDGSHRYGVWEMGMNHPGEIGPLAEIAQPNAAVITNIGTAHIEHMKTREAIADEKAALARAIPEEGYCVMPETDDFFQRIKDQISCEMIGVGAENSAIRAENVVISELGTTFDLIINKESEPVSIPVPGRHMVMNALLAAAVGTREGAGLSQVASGLSRTKMTGGRLERDEWNGVTILNDSYNANPDSVKAAILSLMESPGSTDRKKVVALGFMGELGDHEETAHKEVGKFAADNQVDLLVTVSEKAALIADGTDGRIPAEKFESHEEAATYLKTELLPGDTLLVKGSRAAKMEDVIKLLKQ